MTRPTCTPSTRRLRRPSLALGCSLLSLTVACGGISSGFGTGGSDRNTGSSQTAFGQPDELRELELWGWCPPIMPSETPVDGHLWLQFGTEAKYCGMPDPRFQVDENLARRSELRLVPGDFFVPLTPGTHQVSLPFCFNTVAGTPLPVANGDASLEITDTQVLGRTRVTGTITQPLTDATGADGVLRIAFTGYREDLERGLRLNGDHWPTNTDPDVDLRYCAGPSCAESEDIRLYDACTFDDARIERHTFNFPEGWLEVDVENVAASQWSFAGRAVAARGSIHGSPFLESDYYTLIAQNTDPWSGTRDYMITFSEPVEDVCGIAVSYAYPSDYYSATRVFLIDCEGDSTQTEVTAGAFEVLEDPNAPLP